MPSNSSFAKKIEELTLAELEYTEDFFQKNFGGSRKKQEAPHLSALRQESSRTPQATFSPEMTDADIDDSWLKEENGFEGQLAVDVFQTEQEIIITAAVSGIRTEDLQIDLNGDMLTIKGKRRNKFETVQEDQYFIRECFWGNFSRSIILPVDVQHDAIEATLEYGVLTLRIPKSQRSRNTSIQVVDISSTLS